MFKKLRFLSQKLKSSIDYREANYDSQFVAFGIVGLIHYPLSYLIWQYLSLPYYENLTLRCIATLLCLPLALRKYWPAKLLSWLPLYWYTTLLYCLPFFFTFLLLKNYAATTYLFGTAFALFWLILLVDWLSYIILFTIGVGAAFLCFCLTTPAWHSIHLDFLFAQFIGSIAVMAIFDHNKQRLEKAKLKAISAVGASIAHELRTPLATISSGIKGVKMYLPDLLDAYKLAQQANLPIKEIRANHYQTLLTVLDDIGAETYYANTIVNMLLIKINRTKISPSTFEICSIAQCLNHAIRRYPFGSEKQAQLIHWHNKEDFIFLGKELLVVHVIFNLFKNALYFIAAAGKGEIHIWVEKDAKMNKLHFKDTASGVPPNILPKLFDRFFTTTHNGTGLGLAFCKMVMNSFGGDITCQSQHGAYTNFVLSFPHDPALQRQEKVASILVEELAFDI